MSNKITELQGLKATMEKEVYLRLVSEELKRTQAALKAIPFNDPSRKGKSLLSSWLKQEKSIVSYELQIANNKKDRPPLKIHTISNNNSKYSNEKETIERLRNLQSVIILGLDNKVQGKQTLLNDVTDYITRKNFDNLETKIAEFNTELKRLQKSVTTGRNVKKTPIISPPNIKPESFSTNTANTANFKNRIATMFFGDSDLQSIEHMYEEIKSKNKTTNIQDVSKYIVKHENYDNITNTLYDILDERDEEQQNSTCNENTSMNNPKVYEVLHKNEKSSISSLVNARVCFQTVRLDPKKDIQNEIKELFEKIKAETVPTLLYCNTETHPIKSISNYINNNIDDGHAQLKHLHIVYVSHATFDVVHETGNKAIHIENVFFNNSNVFSYIHPSYFKNFTVNESIIHDTSKEKQMKYLLTFTISDDTVMDMFVDYDIVALCDLRATKNSYIIHKDTNKHIPFHNKNGQSIDVSITKGDYSFALVVMNKLQDDWWLTHFLATIQIGGDSVPHIHDEVFGEQGETSQFNTNNFFNLTNVPCIKNNCELQERLNSIVSSTNYNYY